MPDKVKVTRAESKFLQAELNQHGVISGHNGLREFARCKCGLPLPTIVAADDHFIEVAFVAGWKAHKASTSRKGLKV